MRRTEEKKGSAREEHQRASQSQRRRAGRSLGPRPTEYIGSHNSRPPTPSTTRLNFRNQMSRMETA
jgi:hypothetical protein